MRKITTILILSLFYAAGNSQVHVEGAATTGVLVQRNFRGIGSLIKERPYAYSLGVSLQTDSCQTWAEFYNYPRYGVELLFFSPGNPEDIGQIYCAIPYMRFSLGRKNYLFNPVLRVGIGLGYVTKPFDIDNNYRNIILSSRWNAAATFNFDVEARLSNRISLRSGVGLVHLSNGASKMPNQGVNIFTGSIAASYAFGEEAARLYKDTPDEPKPARQMHIDLFLFGGQKESRVLFDGEKYGMAAFSAQGSYRYKSQSAVGACVDLFYDSSKHLEILKEDSVSISRWQTLQPGLALSHEFFFGRLSAFLQCGVYIPLNKYNDQIAYQRLALRYAASNRIRLHFGLKNHLFVADHIELGLGVRVF